MAPKRKATKQPEAVEAGQSSSSTKQAKAKRAKRAHAPVDDENRRVTRSRAKQDSRLARSVAKNEQQQPKKSAASASKQKKKKGKAKENAETEEAKEVGKTVIVEYCKQCSSFKTRAIQVQEALKQAVPEITVLLNPDKPRKGCFEIREGGGEKFVSLLDMKRPFEPMKDLNMEKVISDLIEKIKS